LTTNDSGRLAANKSWVLGRNTFIEQFERREGIAGNMEGIGSQNSVKTTTLIS
jgi:hypothetical protein